MKDIFTLMKDVLALLGIAWLFGHSVGVYVTFLLAFFNGYRIVVTVNNSGEALFEFFMLPCTCILGWFGLLYFLKKTKNGYSSDMSKKSVNGGV